MNESETEIETHHYEVEDSTFEVKEALDHLGADITTVNERISYDQFFKSHLLQNQPCLFKTFITSGWDCRRLWMEGSNPKWSYLKEAYGAAEVPVANCNEREYNSHKKSTFTLNEYLDYIQDYGQKGYPPSLPNLYLKDWHLSRDCAENAFYRVPQYFSSDWLNEYFSGRKDIHDDYRFVYIGPKGSWTPFHADVFTSYSWSVNVVGRKRWILFPPGEEKHLRDRFGNLAYDILSKDVSNIEDFPQSEKKGKFFDIIQEAGEGLFVPSGWHHQVWNLEDTISINHNWVNGCSILQMWVALRNCLALVKQEVRDCRDMDDWHSHCQLMLKATHGLNYEEFFDLLQCVALPRLKQVQGHGIVGMYGKWKLGPKHAIWDLKQISKTLGLFLSDENLFILPWVAEKMPNELKKKIDNVLETMQTN